MKIIFEIVVLILFNFLLLGKLFVFNGKNKVFVGNYIAFVTIILGCYSIMCFFLLFTVDIFSKVIFLLFGF